MSPLTGAKSRASWIPTFAKRDCPFEIKIDRHFESKVYTSGSAVSGSLTVTPPGDMSFAAFDVVFTGASSTVVQMLQGDLPPSRHTFLELKMPSPQDALPPSLEAGRPYTVPFSFVIPYQLPSASCKHRNPAVHDRHLQLPPTVGGWERDDLTVHSVQIGYAVKARAVLEGKKNGKPVTIQNSHPIKVMPFLTEQPPLHINPRSTMYRMSQEKMVRKDLVSSKMGYLSAMATQPDPIILSADKLEASTSFIRVDLDFIPTSSKIRPPEIHARSAHIQALTTYSSGHIGFLPDQNPRPLIMTHPILPFFISKEISLSKPWNLAWRQQIGPLSASSSRRASETTSDGSEMGEGLDMAMPRRGSKSDDLIKSGSTKHTATLKIPFTLPCPEKKVFLPTFHTCLLSRTYTLHLVLTVGSHGSSLSLTIPVQVAVEGRNIPPESGLPTFAQVEMNEEFEVEMLPAYEVVV
ncbi:hypothetical protein FZEAL_3455 [Fusarium zealandicum]|uniref:Arrestin n=1 Tax=Fusarium zealandicum TaxID=1053134 RepID=A0A8H4UPK7_9HYPO|nr:hypothetical protein FZEAL_3455 [Fusarium zealandicum]